MPTRMHASTLFKLAVGPPLHRFMLRISQVASVFLAKQSTRGFVGCLTVRRSVGDSAFEMKTNNGRSAMIWPIARRGIRGEYSCVKQNHA
jgi:hypothetical protein